MRGQNNHILNSYTSTLQIYKTLALSVNRFLMFKIKILFSNFTLSEFPENFISRISISREGNSYELSISINAVMCIQNHFWKLVCKLFELVELFTLPLI